MIPSLQVPTDARADNERNEEAAMVQPRAVAFRSAFESFYSSANDEIEAAAHSALKLCTSQPLHKTHAFIIQMIWNYAEEDPTIAMQPVHTGAYARDDAKERLPEPAEGGPSLLDYFDAKDLDKLSSANKLKVVVVCQAIPHPFVLPTSSSPVPR